MTVGEMQGYTNRLNGIVDSKQPQQEKDFRLALLMTDLEGAYDIPVLKNEDYEKENPFVMQLYRTVSDERSL